MTHLQKELSNLVMVYEFLRYAYFWKPPMIASARRAIEDEYTVPKITWEEGGHIYSAEISTTVSCNHVYVYKEFYKDGKRTKWVAIRNSIERLNREEME